MPRKLASSEDGTGGTSGTSTALARKGVDKPFPLSPGGPNPEDPEPLTKETRRSSRGQKQRKPGKGLGNCCYGTTGGILSNPLGPTVD